MRAEGQIVHDSAVVRSPKMTYAGAVNKLSATKRARPLEVDSVSGWVAIPTPSMHGTTQPLVTREQLMDEPDMLDATFVDFHREVRSLMLDRYGLLGRSEAADLEAAISPCVRFVTPESELTELP